MPRAICRLLATAAFSAALAGCEAPTESTLGGAKSERIEIHGFAFEAMSQVVEGPPDHLIGTLRIVNLTEQERVIVHSSGCLSIFYVWDNSDFAGFPVWPPNAFWGGGVTCRADAVGLRLEPYEAVENSDTVSVNELFGDRYSDGQYYFSIELGVFRRPMLRAGTAVLSRGR